MGTTIQISNELVEKLKNMKLYEKESYEELIWDLIEDRMELSPETRKSIEEYEDDLKNDRKEKFVNFEEIRKRL